MVDSTAPPSPNFLAWLARPQSKIAITGPAGWVGRALVHAALAAGVPTARLRLYGSRSGSVEAAGQILPMQALEAATLGDGDWLVVHTAIVGPDRPAGASADQTRAFNDSILAEARRLAETGDVRRFVFASSGAAGHAPSLPYGAMKLAHEAALADWAGKSGPRLLMPRIFNLGGPYINNVGRYVLGDFIQRLQQGRPIEIGARRPVFRSYVHVLELAQVLYGMALDEASPDAPFDTAGREIVELGDLASTVAEALGHGGADIRRHPLQDEAPDWYVGDGAVYQAARLNLGGLPVDLQQIIHDTGAYLAGSAFYRTEAPTLSAPSRGSVAPGSFSSSC